MSPQEDETYGTKTNNAVEDLKSFSITADPDRPLHKSNYSKLEYFSISFLGDWLVSWL